MKKTNNDRGNYNPEEFEESKKFMDEPPDEDLKENMRSEKQKFTAQKDSQSERKYRSDRSDKKK
ncbi:hypothetical protein SAMN05216238_11625 [Lentibacillus persicus]|uniref:Uncharacterized protein n=1 Tax=Lentibacillus persicus TaxID=640948 RepID=A0A1I2ALY0_9BACI|nr:hypothetical protein [Lentibacillus persicus]SFE43963.1 hypothetical protein SAMN05216238_11625 [Lentibacillus persicus]